MAADDGALAGALIAAPSRYQRSVQRPDAYSVATTLLHYVDGVIVNPDVARRRQVGPLFEEGPLVVENLNAIVLAVADENAAVLVDPDVVKQRELARTRPFTPPGQQQLPLRAELVDPVSAVAVGRRTSRRWAQWPVPKAC